MLTWREVVARWEKTGLSRPELARRAGISEQTVVKGMRRGSKLNLATRQVVEAAIIKAEQEAEAA